MSAVGTLTTDVSFVCVGTPANGNGSLDVKFVRRVAEEIGRGLAAKADYHLVIVRSTTLPGTTEEIVIPAIEAFIGEPLAAPAGAATRPAAPGA